MSDLTQYVGNDFRADDPQYQSTGNDYGPLPPAEYPCEIVGAEIKQTKAGNGAYVEVTFEIIGDNYAGRKIWHRMNINNPNPKAVIIGKEKLSELGLACGIVVPRNTNEFVGKFCRVKTYNKNDRTEVGKVSSYGTGGPTAQAATMTQAPPKQNNNGAMPWATPPASRSQPGGQSEEVPF